MNSPFAATYEANISNNGTYGNIIFTVGSNGKATGTFTPNVPLGRVGVPLTGTVDATGNFNLKGAYSGTPVTVTGAIIDTSGKKVANGIVKVGTDNYGSFTAYASPTIAPGTGRIQLTLGSGNTFSAFNGTGTRSVNSSTGATSFSLSASRNMGAGSYPEIVSVSLSKAGIHAGDTFVVGTDNVSVQHYQKKSLTVFENETSAASNPPGTVKVTGVYATSISLLLSNVSMQSTGSSGSGDNVGSSYMLNGTFSANRIQQN